MRGVSGLWRWFLRLWRSTNLPTIAFFVISIVGINLFFVTHDSLVVCLALMVPIILLAWLSSWWVGGLVGFTAAMLVAPYSYAGIFYVSPVLSPLIWLYLSGCYTVLGALIGLQGTIVRRQQTTIYADMNDRLLRAQASSKRYESLLEEMSEGQLLLHRMNNELALLNTIATSANSSLDLLQVQQTALANISALLHVDELHLYWLNQQRDALRLQCSYPATADLADHGSVSLQEGLLGRVLDTQHVQTITDEAELHLCPAVMSANIASVIAVPLRARGRLLGVLTLGRKNGNAFSDDDSNFLESVGRVLAVAMENANLFQEAQELSLTDDLTELANRRFLNLRLSTEVARVSTTGDPLSLAVIDIDFFKIVNDRYGHPAGDEVLRQFAKRVQREIRGTDIFCRLGGEEFALMAINTPFQVTLAILERICRHIGQIPFELADGSYVPLTVSAGVAYLQPGINSGDELIAAADRALYAAKAAGRNRVQIYAPDTLAQAIGG